MAEIERLSKHISPRPPAPEPGRRRAVAGYGGPGFLRWVGFADLRAFMGAKIQVRRQERDLTYEAAKKRMCDLFWVSARPKRGQAGTARSRSKLL